MPQPERVVLDTNVLVRLTRADAVGRRIADAHDLLDRTERPLISVVTVGEIRGLALKRGWQQAKQDRLDQLIHELVVIRLDQGSVIQSYAEIYTYCERDSVPARPMGQNDMWIAATACASDALLITTDTDFDHLHGKLLQVAKHDSRTGARI